MEEMKTAMSEGPQIAPYVFNGTSEPVGPDAVDDIGRWRLWPERMTRQNKRRYEEQGRARKRASRIAKTFISSHPRDFTGGSTLRSR